MKKFSMGIVVLILTIAGAVIVNPLAANGFIKALFGLMILWAFVEFFIGMTRSFENIVPSHSIVKISRGLWTLSVLYAWLDCRYGWTRIPIPDSVEVCLLAVCIAGLLIRLWAVTHLGKSFTYDIKLPEGGELITTGPYRVIRHPSYLGVSILSTLPGIVVGSWAGFAGMAITTVVHIVYRIEEEEKVLHEAFGDDFAKYKSATYRLFPFFF